MRGDQCRVCPAGDDRRDAALVGAAGRGGRRSEAGPVNGIGAGRELTDQLHKENGYETAQLVSPASWASNAIWVRLLLGIFALIGFHLILGWKVHRLSKLDSFAHGRWAEPATTTPHRSAAAS